MVIRGDNKIMCITRHRIPKRALVTLSGIMIIFWMILSPQALANDCGWPLGEAQAVLSAWQGTIGAFHSDLTGENAVSYRDLISSWGTPVNVNDPASKLPHALDAFIEAVNGYPGTTAREEELIDAISEIATAEMLLGTEDFIEVLDQEHIFSIDLNNPIGSPNPIDEEILLLEGPSTVPILNDPLYGHFPQGRRDCIGHYKKAVNVFLQGFSTEAGYAAFANQDFSSLGDEPDDESDDETPAEKSLKAMGLFCRASARKARASMELVDRQYRRDYDRNNPAAPVDAKHTVLVAGQAAYLETIMIAAVMPEEGLGKLVDSKDFQIIGGNLLEMEKVNDSLSRGLNPFGYEKNYVPFKFDPDIAQTIKCRNNYEQMNHYLEDDIANAISSINEARADKDYMRDRLREIERNYNQFQQMVQNQTNQDEGVRAQFRRELAEILGYGSTDDGLDNDQDGTLNNPEENGEPDQVSYFSNDGEIGRLVIEINKAKLKVDRIDQEMDNIQSLVNIKLELLAKLLKINADQIKERTGIIGEITDDKVAIIKETGEEMASLAEEEAAAKAEDAENKGFVDNISKIVTGIGLVVATVYTGGATAPALAAISKGWAITSGITQGSAGAACGIADLFDAQKDGDLCRKLGDIQARRERAAALEKADLTIKEGELQIRLSELDARVYNDRTNAEFEADIKSLLLERELLTIDLLIAEEDVRQHTMRLSSAIKRALRLLADRDEFEQRARETTELQKFYQDPAARILEDQLIMEAAEDFRLAAKMVYLTGKAMEYEINEYFPRLDDVFKMRTAEKLSDLKKDLWQKYWYTPDIHNDTPTTRTLSLRSDLLGLPSAGDTEADTKFRKFIEQNITIYGDLVIKFDTYLTVGRYDDPWLPPINFFGQPSVRYNDYFPWDHWNEKIESIRVNVNGMRNVGYDGASASLTHYGTSFIRSRNAELDEFGYIIKDDVKPWDLEPRTTGSFIASVDGHINYPEYYYYNDQLVARSVATSDWRLRIQGHGLAYVEDLLAITDIEIIIRSKGYPIQY